MDAYLAVPVRFFPSLYGMCLCVRGSRYSFAINTFYEKIQRSSKILLRVQFARSSKILSSKMLQWSYRYINMSDSKSCSSCGSTSTVCGSSSSSSSGGNSGSGGSGSGGSCGGNSSSSSSTSNDG